MGRLLVITTPDLAPGFQLAGVETLAAATVEAAESALRQLLDGRDASLVLIHRALLQGMSAAVQRRVESSLQPVVMPITGRPTAMPGQEHQRHLTEMVRRTVGFHINFGGG